MTSSISQTDGKLTAERLARRAMVYVRQSSPGQVKHNLESQRMQYALADRARALGFSQVEIIDDDLGKSAGAYSAAMIDGVTVDIGDTTFRTPS